MWDNAGKLDPENFQKH